MNCKYCNNEIPDGQGVCNSCGAAVDKSEAEISCIEDTVEEQTDIIEETVEIKSEDTKEDVNDKTADGKDACFGPAIKSKKSIGRAIGTIVSCFLCIFLAFAIFIFSVLHFFNINVSISAIKKVLPDIDINDFKVTDIVNESTLREMGFNVQATDFVGFIYNNIGQEDLEKVLRKQELEQIVDNEDLINTIVDVIAENAQKLLEGVETAVLTANDICDIIEDEREFIEDVVGYEITDQHISNIRAVLNDNFDELFRDVEISDVEGLSADTDIMAMISDLAVMMVTVSVILIVLICILIFLLLRSFKRGFKYTGITAVVCGALETLLAVGSLALMGIIFTDDLGPAIIVDIIGNYFGNAVMSLLGIGLTILIIGVIFIAVSIILSVLQKRKARKTV